MVKIVLRNHTSFFFYSVLVGLACMVLYATWDFFPSAHGQTDFRRALPLHARTRWHRAHLVPRLRVVLRLAVVVTILCVGCWIGLVHETSAAGLAVGALAFVLALLLGWLGTHYPYADCFPFTQGSRYAHELSEFRRTPLTVAEYVSDLELSTGELRARSRFARLAEADVLGLPDIPDEYYLIRAHWEEREYAPRQWYEKARDELLKRAKTEAARVTKEREQNVARVWQEARIEARREAEEYPRRLAEYRAGPRYAQCSSCHGQGSFSVRCAECGGTGRVRKLREMRSQIPSIDGRWERRTYESFWEEVACPVCQARRVPCSRCHGEGRVQQGAPPRPRSAEEIAKLSLLPPPASLSQILAEVQEENQWRKTTLEQFSRCQLPSRSELWKTLEGAVDERLWMNARILMNSLVMANRFEDASAILRWARELGAEHHLGPRVESVGRYEVAKRAGKASGQGIPGRAGAFDHAQETPTDRVTPRNVRLREQQKPELTAEDDGRLSWDGTQWAGAALVIGAALAGYLWVWRGTFFPVAAFLGFLAGWAFFGTVGCLVNESLEARDDNRHLLIRFPIAAVTACVLAPMLQHVFGSPWIGLVGGVLTFSITSAVIRWKG